MPNEIDQLYLRSKAIESLAADKNALGRVAWDRVESIPNDSGMMQTVGFDDRSGMSVVLDEAGAGEGENARERPRSGYRTPIQTPYGGPGGETIQDIGIGIASGAAHAIDEVTKTFRLDKLANILESEVPLGKIELPEPTTMAGQITQTLTQATVAMLPVAKAAKAAGVASQFLQWTLGGAFADMAAFSPEFPAIANITKELGALPNETLEKVRRTIEDWMAKDEDDSELEKRLKAGVEGGIIGTAFYALVPLAQAAKGLWKAGGPEFADKLTDTLTRLARDESGAIPGGRGPATGVVEPFYSKALKTVSEATTERATGQQWLATLKNSGVKDEEIAWLGLDDYLQGQKMIPKADLDAYVRANQVEIKEVTKGGQIELPEGYIWSQGPGGWAIRRSRDRSFVTMEHFDKQGALGEATDKEFTFEQIREIEGPPTKFSQHTLPGGENYRELLLTLPNTRVNYTWTVVDPKTQKATTYASEQAAREAAIGGKIAYPNGERAADFYGGHFEEPNVLAHVRFTERTDAEGKRVLFIEEIQSDWHAKGRRSGYQGEVQALSPEEKTRLNELAGRNNLGPVTGLNAEERIEFHDLLQRNTEASAPSGVPDAHFKKTWHELVFRRMVRWGAENDFDRIGWTTGEQQAERYDLSKHIKELRVNRVELRVNRYGAPDRPSEMHYVLTADTQEGRTVDIGAQTKESLAAAIGKDMADKIIENPEKVQIYSGLDLKVGGESLKALYDTMLPSYAKKLGKKFGATAGEVKIGSGGRVQQMDDGSFQALTDRNLVVAVDLPTREAAEAALKTSVHSMDITPAMRETAMREGFPLFTLGAGTAGAAGPRFEGGGGAEDLGGSEGADQFGGQFDPNQPDVQVAGLFGGLAKPFMSRAAREGLKHPPRPRVPTPAEAQILDTYASYKQGSPVVEGLDFNMERIQTNQETKALINTVSRAYAPQIDKAKWGVVPHAVTRQVADLLGTDTEAATRAIATLPSEVEGLHVRALVMRDMLVQSAESVDSRAQKIVLDPTQVTDQELLDFYSMMEKHAAFEANMKGVQTEIARAQSAARIIAKAPPFARAQAVQEALQNAGGRSKVKELASLWMKTPVEKRAYLATEGLAAKSVGVLREIWINGLLSGLRTHEINFASNQLFTAWQLPERVVASGIGAVRRGAARAGVGNATERVYMGEVPGMMLGWVEGIGDGFRLGWGTFKTGEPSSALSKLEQGRYNAISSARWGLDESSLLGRFVDITGVGVRLPGRFLIAADEFQKGIARGMERRALAYRYAQMDIARGKTPDEATETWASVMADDHEIAKSMIDEFADTVTFTRELGEAGQAVQSFARKVPGAWLVAPFIRTPVNIVKEFSRRSPLSLLMPSFWKDITAGGARRDLALAKISTGSAAMAYANYLAGQEIITGGGPSDPRMKRVWLEKYQPYSINLRQLMGDESFEKMGLESEWVPYGRLAPVGLLFGVAADFADYRKWAPRDMADESEEALATRAVASTLHTVSEQTFLLGLANFAAAYQDPERYFERLVATTGGSMIPFSSMIRSVEAARDPAQRETRRDPYEDNPAAAQFYALLNEWKARTPGFSTDLPPRRNHWGEPILAYEGEWWQAFNAFAPRKDKSRPIDEELIRLRYPLAMPRREAFGVKLNPQRYDVLVRALNEVRLPFIDDEGKGLNMREALDRLVGMPLYKAYPNDDLRIKEIQQLRTEFLDAAKKEMIAPGSKYFDAELMGWVIRSSVQEPLGIPFKP